jgi:hypothetical protein
MRRDDDHEMKKVTKKRSTIMFNAHPRCAHIIGKAERAIRPRAAANAPAALEDGDRRAAVGERARGRHARHACEAKPKPQQDLHGTEYA